MPWGDFPDKGIGDNDLQSVLFNEYLEVLHDGIRGLNCVVDGCVVTGGADMTPEVTKGSVLSNGTLFPVTAGTFTIGAADASNPRLDLLVIDSAGAKQTRAGTAGANPKPPARTANDVVLAVVYVPAADTSIETTKIVDLRVVRDRGVVLKRTTSPVSFNTTLGIQTYATLTLPSGLLVAGRQLRFKAAGNYLSNSGTPTWTLTIAYGGTTLFADVTAATAADTDRGAWNVEGVLNASANAVQQLDGTVTFQTPGVKTAAAAGIGDMAVVTHVSSPFRGAGAVDSDAADRTLTIQWTMSVSNVAVETVCDYSLFELV